MKKYYIRNFCPYPDFPLNILFRKATEAKGLYFHEGAHLHDFIEIIYILCGSGWMCFNGRMVPCFPGDIYILPLGTVHEFKVLSAMEYCNLLIHPKAFTRTELAMLKAESCFEKIFCPKNGIPTLCRLPFPATENLRRLLVQAGKCAENKDSCFRIRFKSAMTLILCEILSLIPGSEVTGNASSLSERSTQNISLIVDYMIRHFRESVTIPRLAKRVNMSQAGFIRFFHEQTGIPPIRYLNKLRIYEACRMLTEQKDHPYSMSEIAYACGFSNSSYFAEIFRKVMDLSPSEFAAREKGLLQETQDGSGL